MKFVISGGKPSRTSRIDSGTTSDRFRASLRDNLIELLKEKEFQFQTKFARDKMDEDEA